MPGLKFDKYEITNLRAGPLSSGKRWAVFGIGIVLGGIVAGVVALLLLPGLRGSSGDDAAQASGVDGREPLSYVGGTSGAWSTDDSGLFYFFNETNWEFLVERCVEELPPLVVTTCVVNGSDTAMQLGASTLAPGAQTCQPAPVLAMHDDGNAGGGSEEFDILSAIGQTAEQSGLSFELVAPVEGDDVLTLVIGEGGQTSGPEFPLVIIAVDTEPSATQEQAYTAAHFVLELDGGAGGSSAGGVLQGDFQFTERARREFTPPIPIEQLVDFQSGQSGGPLYVVYSNGQSSDGDGDLDLYVTNGPGAADGGVRKPVAGFGFVGFSDIDTAVPVLCTVDNVPMAAGDDGESTEEITADAVCGNGVLEGSEVCDGNDLSACESGQTCSASCTCLSASTEPLSTCGDGVLDTAHEQCEANDLTFCTADQFCQNCTCITIEVVPPPVEEIPGADGTLCGDGICQAGESADWCGDCTPSDGGPATCPAGQFQCPDGSCVLTPGAC